MVRGRVVVASVALLSLGAVFPGFLLLASPALAQGFTYTVPTQNNADPPGASCSANHVCGSLRAAIHAANSHPGSKIVLGAATYAIGHVGDAPNSGDLRLTAGMTIAGRGASGTTVKQSDGVSRVLTIAPGAKVTLIGLRVAGGRPAAAPGANATGGGILTGHNSSLTLTSAVITGNTAAGGSGVPSATGQSGGAGSGGGISAGGSLVLTNSTVAGNAARGGSGFGGSVTGYGGYGQGGGIYATAPVTLSSSSVRNNHAIGGAGGSGFSGNGGQGGGVYAGGGLAVTRSTIAGNSATGGASGGQVAGNASGGGVYAVFAPSSFSSSTISQNSAMSGSGGGSSAECYADGGGIATNWTLTVNGRTTVSGNMAIGSAGSNSPTAPGCPAQGGGIFATNGVVVTLAGITVTANDALGGSGGSGAGAGGNGGSAAGGGLELEGVTARLADMTISQNHASGGEGGPGGTSGGTGGEGYGGGIDSADGKLSLSADRLSSNSAIGGSGANGSPIGAAGSGHGGGIGLRGSPTTVSIYASTLDGNAANGGAPVTGGPPGRADGGGIADLTSQAAAPAAILNSTITGNRVIPGAPSANDSGGGVSSFDGPVTLISDTIARNTAGGSIGTGGNIWAGGKVKLQDSLIAGGIAAGSGGTNTNCIVTGSITDAGYNLEDSSASSSQCGLAAVRHDRLVASGTPVVRALAGNGGPTPTMALTPTSQAISDGGTCGGLPHKVDQRGRPRRTPCDIGAFEHQIPQPVRFPAVTGTPAVGHLLTCSKGTWTGDGKLTFAYRWLRNGLPISGATGRQKRVTAADRGKALSCRVNATGTYGVTTAHSSPVHIR